MPSFEFHIKEGRNSVEQIETQCVSYQAASKAAAELIGQMMIDRSPDFQADQDWTLTVVDAWGLTLLSLSIVATCAPAVSSIRPSA